MFSDSMTDTGKLFQSLIVLGKKALKRFRSNLECGVLKVEGVSTAKIVLFHHGSTELRRCENCVFFLPVNILTGVALRLLGPHDTLPCVLIWLSAAFANGKVWVGSDNQAHDALSHNCMHDRIIMLKLEKIEI